MKLSSFRTQSVRSMVAGLALAAFAVMGVPSANAAFIDTEQTISVVSAGGYYQEIIYYYTTGQLEVSPVINFDSDVLYTLPAEEWVGIFHYDYVAGAFTEAVYTYNDIF